MVRYGLVRRIAAAGIGVALWAGGGAVAQQPAPAPAPAAGTGASLRWETEDGTVRRDRGELGDAVETLRRSRPGTREAAAAARAVTRTSLRSAGFAGPLDDVVLPWTELVAVGDLDGDGRPDTVELATVGNDVGIATLVRGRRGSDGGRLWEVRVPGYAFVRGARVGASGTNGVLLFSVVQEVVAAPVMFGLAESWTMAAYDGRGTQVWTRPMPPSAVAFSPVAFVLAGLPALFGIADMLPGKADELVLGTVNMAGAVVAWAGADPAFVVNGADGTVGTVPAPGAYDPEGGVLTYVVPDLSGDGLADLVFEVGARGRVRLAAMRATGGAPVWTATDLDLGWITPIDVLGDVTGDRLGDLALIAGDSDEPKVLVLSGADGKVAAEYRGHGALSLGDVDRDGRRDVTVVTYTLDDPGLTLRTVTYAASKRVLNQHTERFSSAHDEAELFGYVSDIGDVQGDGVSDLGMVLGAWERERVVSRAAVVDGRTGKLLHRKAGAPLHAPVDRRGDDLLTITRESKSLMRVSALQGSTGSVLWSTLVPNTTTPFSYGAWATWADVDGDRCTDVVVSLWGDDGSTIAVLRGRDGRLAWGVRATDAGHRALTGVVPGPDRNRGC